MLVPVVGIREMRVAVRQRPVHMGMGMVCPRCHGWLVRVVMVFVAFAMCVRMVVFLRLMRVAVLMPLGQVQAHSQRHERACNQQLRTQLITQ